MGCEKLIIKRFLEIYNSENGTNFSIDSCVKKDELPNFRNIKTYDYHCEDSQNNKQIGIEISRLIPHHRQRIVNLKMRVANLKEQLKRSLKGDFLFVLSLYIFKHERNKMLRRIFKEIYQEILSLSNNIAIGELINLSCCDGAGIIKKSEEDEFNLIFLPITLASASDKDIKRALIDALSKFEANSENERKNIILLVELITIARRDISYFIKDLEFGFNEEGIYTGIKKDFSIIDEIYHIAISKDSIIAKIYPSENEFGFFSEEDFKRSEELYNCCLDYFLH
jgi:hypothetical protein